MTDGRFVPRLFVAIFAATLLATASIACSDDTDPGHSPDAGYDADPGHDADAGVDDADIEDTGPDDTGTEDTGPTDPDVGPGPDTSPDPDTGPDELPDLAIDEIRPHRGSIEGGTPFVIEGQGFTDDTVVLFGSNLAETDVVDSDLAGITPAGDNLGPVTVRVIDEETGEDSIADGFTYIEPLEIEALSPSLLPTKGGLQVTIDGRGFSEDTRVTVGGKAAADHEFVNPNRLRFIAPPNPAGPADLRLVDHDDTYLKTDAVTYFAPVALDAVDPPFGAVSGGEEVVLYGNQFDASLHVVFGSSAAAVLDVADDGTQATVLTPAQASPGVVDVRVETDNDGHRLHDAFAYLDEDIQELHLDAVVPPTGSTDGGQRVYLTGYFADLSGPAVSFGDDDATVVAVDDHIIAVDTPSVSDAGPVEVTVSDAQQSTSTDDAFTFYVPLSVTDLSPAEGDVDGGTQVTVTGSGFDALAELSLAGISVGFDVIDGQTLQFDTPPANPGPADLVLATDDGRELIVDDAFEYLGPLQLWGFDPTRGSVAGNTYVELYGTGFREDTEVFFGTEPATELELLDSTTIALRTPAHPSDAVEVTAEQDGDQALADELYTYFNPGAQTGGAWGNPIDGSVNVTVFNIGGQPVENAFVMLSTSADSTYTGATDAMGLVTLSGPDVFGEQTISVAAAEHSSATVQYVDAENITVFLHPDDDGDPPMPPPPPSATYYGNINGLQKIEVEANLTPTQRIRAIVLDTLPSMHDDRIIDPGNQFVVDVFDPQDDAEYLLHTRIGQLALVAFAGIYDSATGEFTPTYMGTARYLNAADGGEYEVDIDLDIPLAHSFGLSFDGAPIDSDDPNAPDTNHAHVFLDLAIDGVYGPLPTEYTSQSNLMQIEHLPWLSGALSDASFNIIAQSTREPFDDFDNPPRSQATLTGITNLNQNYSTPPMVSTLEFITPQQGQSPENGLVQWELHGDYAPDFYYFQLIYGMGQIGWEAFVPGDRKHFVFPDFPDLSDYAVENDDGIEIPPMPYVGQSYIMVGVGYRYEDVSLENFTYDNLSTTSADAVSLTFLNIVL